MAGRVPARHLARRAAVTALTVSGAGRLARGAARVRHPLPINDEARVWTSSRFSTAESVLLLAHYDARGTISFADWHLIDAFRDAGFAVGLSTTMDVSHEELVAETSGRLDAICTRANVGFDFGSWARLIEKVLARATPPRQLILLNNSVYGPLHPLGPFLVRVDALGHAVTGLTGSGEFAPHASSYFLAFDERAVTAPGFATWWRSIRPSTSKWGAILAHELRWHHDLGRAAGGSAGLLVPARRGRTNPSSFGWADLVGQGIPFVKKSLFGPNYDRVDMGDWRTELERLAPEFDPGLIERDLAFTARS